MSGVPQPMQARRERRAHRRAGQRLFTAEAIDDFNVTAAVAPSSRFLARAMVRPLPLEDARTVLELGPGTGAMTGALLERMRDDARLIAVERNPRFADFLRGRFTDPRFEVLEADATELPAVLDEAGIEGLDAILSSLGMTWIPIDGRLALLDALCERMHDHSVLTQFQYVHGRFHPGFGYDIGKLLRSYFRTVSRRLVVFNVPPALAYRCTL